MHAAFVCVTVIVNEFSGMYNLYRFGKPCNTMRVILCTLLPSMASGFQHSVKWSGVKMEEEEKRINDLIFVS